MGVQVGLPLAGRSPASALLASSLYWRGPHPGVLGGELPDGLAKDGVDAGGRDVKETCGRDTGIFPLRR